MPLPHSPQMGKHDEAWMILKRVHDTNMRAKGTPEKVFTVSDGSWHPREEYVRRGATTGSVSSAGITCTQTHGDTHTQTYKYI